MGIWRNMTDTFSEERRHYSNTYLEICEVYDEAVEVSIFSADNNQYEIYVSYGIIVIRQIKRCLFRHIKTGLL